MEQKLKESEENLKKLKKELEWKVEKRPRELKKSKDTLKKLNKLLEQEVEEMTKKLNETEEKYQTSYEYSKDGISLIDTYNANESRIMDLKNRKSGIEILDVIPWGTHLCLFYEKKEDLFEILIPYFKAGLENNEYCIWVTSEPLNQKDVEIGISKAIPNFEQYLKRKQIEIIPYFDFYLKNNEFDLQRVLDEWIEKLKYALNEGYDGLRVTGNTAWLEKKDWKSFTDYEAEINSVIPFHKMIAICTYALEKCGPFELLDVINNHQFALIRREDKWKYFKSMEQIKAEQKLRESEEKYRLISENANDLITILNQKFEHEYINEETYLKILGYSNDDMLGKTRLDLIHPDDLKQGMKALRNGFKYGEGIAELRLKHKDGHYIWIETKGKTFIDSNGETKALTISRDISERKKIEQKLKESEEKYRNILDNIQEGYLEVDLKGNYTFVNDYHCYFFGISKDDTIGKNYAEFVDKKHKKILFEIFNKVYRREVPSARFEIEAIRYDGENRIYEGTCNLKLDYNGRRIGFYSLTRDITERKEAEKLMIEELNKLTELDRMRREFISRASHELKTPLTSIYSATQLLLELYKDQLGKNALELVEMIEKGGYRLKGLVEKLLNFSRIESERFQLYKKMENATEIIRDCISNMAYLANKRNIILNVDLPETFNIELDKLRFEQVVINLLSNAIKNTPPIGDIQISLSKQNGFMVLSVKDSGVGLTKSERGKIFKKFGKIERYGKGLDIIPEGVGLGLFISKEIVENHRGKIFVESKGRNKGANFIVKLPFK